MLLYISLNFNRIRGFNGFGAGEFTYKIFWTRPAAPAVPRIIKLSSDAVTLQWTFSPSFFKCLEELKHIFETADKDKSGSVERDELGAILDSKASSSNNITQFLKKVQKSLGVSFEDGFDALFDMIECDDDGKLTWDEFEKFFFSSGWTGGTGGTGGTSSSISASMTGSKSVAATSSDRDRPPANTSITYIIEQVFF